MGVALAAGRGTRLRSARPKVLHEVAGRPLLAWALEAVRAAGCRRLLVVVGHGAEEVKAAVPREVGWVPQEELRGTGDALARVEGHLDGPALLLVVSGDAPLVTPATLGTLVERATAGWGAMAVAELDSPGSLGRVIASPDGTLERIVEAADATDEQLAVRLVNAGCYALPAPEVFDYLRGVEADNAKGEYYLTDALGAAAADGRPVALHRLTDPGEALGVNDRADLARVHALLLRRQTAALMAAGVTVLDPERTVVEAGVSVGEDVVLHPGVSLLGDTRLGAGCTLHQGAWIRDSVLGAGVTVEPYSVLDGARVGDRCRLGPFARLRPGTVLGDGAKVGNFVEVKNSRLGAGVKASHLAYVGDAEVGEGANLGAGVVTCNYDGVSKHRTEIGRRAFIGSDTMLVAPVRVGDEAVTGAGSVVTKDVPDGALAVERSRQRNVIGWSGRRKDEEKA